MNYKLAGTVITDGEIRRDQMLVRSDGMITFSGPRESFDPTMWPDAEEIAVPSGGAVVNANRK